MNVQRALRSWPHAAIGGIFCVVVHGCAGSSDSKPENSSLTAGFRGFGGASSAGVGANSGNPQTTSSIVPAGGSRGFGGTANSSASSRANTSSATGGDTSKGIGGTTSADTAMGSGGTTAMGGTSGARTTTMNGGVTPTGGSTASHTATKTGTGATSAIGGSSGTRTTVATGGTLATGGSSSTIGTGGVSSTGGNGSSATGGKSATGGSVGCSGSSKLKAGDNKTSLQFGGRSRSYVVYVPNSVKAGTAVPLIFDYHGHGSNGAQEESSSGWKQKADQNGFIMVYPDGVDSSWNVGNCCGLALSENVDDVGFTRAMLDVVRQAACIDPKRVYATGMSNGAGFTHRLACEAADVIAAIAAASADLVTDPCTPARPISELSIRGLSDTTVAYAGGNTGSTGWYSPGAKKTLDLWKAIDQCAGVATTSHQYCEGYTSCGAGVEIALCSLPSTGHDTYNNAVGLKVPDVAWEMFQRQPMP